MTLPNLIVGTVGGGTYLPTAEECLEILGCAGAGQARKFAEICAVVVLAGELAIIGALSAGQFASAHASSRRHKRPAGTWDGAQRAARQFLSGKRDRSTIFS